MSRKLTVLDRVEIASPCDADWNKMKGNDVVRFCEHCNLNVHDLSSMTRTKATKLVMKSKGRLCVRYIRQPDGVIQTATRQVYQISRRASRIAAGVFSATLSLSATAYAQGGVIRPNEKEKVVANETLAQKDEGKIPSLKGTITDPNGAVIAGATVKAINQKTKQEQTVTSNEEGYYEFYDLEEGEYAVQIFSPGFRVKDETVQLTSDANLRLDKQLDITEIMVMGGGMIVISYQSPLLNAISDGDVNAVREQLAKKVDVNAKEEGTTALHLAASQGNAEIVSLLLEAGANPNIRDEEKQTPLMMLYGENASEILDLLLRAGAKVNVKDAEGRTPLMVAAEEGNIEAIQTLLTAGAKVNKRDNEGCTALMYAVEEENVESVKAILAAGADVRIRNNDGKTALQIAIESDNEEIIELLKGYGSSE